MIKKTLHIIAAVTAFVFGCEVVEAQKLTILTTNDTHSMIDPDAADDLGGVMRRKVVIDSVRAADEHVLLIDAGDFVQGTLYFNMFRGEVEQKLMNALGYDIRILGNHEFDNGIEELAEVLADSEAELLATNYDLSQSPLAKKFRPYTIREVGDRTVGIIAINLNPEGMISEGNYNGLVYNDAIEAANAAAWWLKHIEKVDAVIAVTHIGYRPSMPPGDKMLAEASREIDLIIGGHSHDLIKPTTPAGESKTPYLTNADGRQIVVTQNGKSGKYVGKITLDLDNDNAIDYDVIRIDSRLDDRVDGRLADIIKPYRAGVDSLMRVRVADAAIDMPHNSPELMNFAADFVLNRGRQLASDIDFSIINKGGLRHGLTKGRISEGEIITMMPFYNYVNVIDIKGADLLEAFDVMASQGGNGVSANVTAVYDRNTHKCVEVTVDGAPIDPERTYRIATIDYLYKGGDYMKSLTRGTLVAKSDRVLYDDLLDDLRSLARRGRKIKPSTVRRMAPLAD